MVFLSAFLAGCNTQKEAGSKTNSEIVHPTLTPNEYKTFATVFIDANKAKILGNFNRAIELFKKALEIDPTSAAAQYEIARIYTADKNYSAALAYAKGAYDIDPVNIWYAKQLGELYSKLGQLDNSIAVFKSIIESHPNEYKYYFNLGSLLSAQGKYDDALKLYEALEVKAGPLKEITLQRQMIYIDMGDYESALKEIHTLIEQNPEEIRLYGMKAEIYQKLDQPDKAKAIYEEMLTMEPENGLVLLSLYDLVLKEGNTEKADSYLNRAFGSSNLSIDVKVNILLNFLSDPSFKSKKAQIIALMKRLEETHPHEAKTYSVEGDIYFNLGQIDSARVKFRKAVELDPNHAPIWRQILLLDSQLNDFDALAAESAKALELFPRQPVFYLFNAIALLQKKKPGKAIEQLQAGKNLVVDNPKLLGQFYASLGDAYHEMNNHQSSDQAYEKALSYNPANVIVLNNYAYYLSLRDTALDKAEQMAKKANDLRPDVASFQDTYSWVLYKNQNYQNALFWIQEAMKNGGANDAEVLGHYGDILIALNRNQEAITAWKKALKLGGNSEILQQKIRGANKE